MSNYLDQCLSFSMQYQPCCCEKVHQLRHRMLAIDVTNPAATLVLGLRLCMAEADVPAAGTSEAGNQTFGLEADDDGEYDQTTYEHRRSIEADYHPVHCLAHQPQVFIYTLHLYILNAVKVSVRP